MKTMRRIGALFPAFLLRFFFSHMSRLWRLHDRRLAG
jgi:hypothetical protein